MPAFYQSLRFNLQAVYIEYKAGKVTLEQVLLETLQFLPAKPHSISAPYLLIPASEVHNRPDPPSMLSQS